MVAIGDDRVWFLQTTTTPNQSARCKKIKSKSVRDTAIDILVMGQMIEVWGWRPGKGDGAPILTRTAFRAVANGGRDNYKLVEEVLI